MTTPEERVQRRADFNYFGEYREGPGFNFDLNGVATLLAEKINLNRPPPAPPAAPARIVLPPPIPAAPAPLQILPIQTIDCLTSNPPGLPVPAGLNDWQGVKILGRGAQGMVAHFTRTTPLPSGINDVAVKQATQGNWLTYEAAIMGRFESALASLHIVRDWDHSKLTQQQALREGFTQSSGWQGQVRRIIMEFRELGSLQDLLTMRRNQCVTGCGFWTGLH